MSPIHLQVRYRPIRIGLCVKEGDLEELRKALRLTHTLWGGRFNPIIPVGDPELARLLVKTLRVDCLYCISESPEGNALLTEFKHLLWPDFHKELFIDGVRGRDATFLDIYHPAIHIHEDHIKGRDQPAVTGTMFRWSPTDPLADVFLATFGAYPTKEDIGKDYDAFFCKHLATKEIVLADHDPIPPNAYRPPVFSRRRFLFRLLSSGVLVGQGSVGEGNLGKGPSPASLGSTAGAWPIRPANTPANHRTKSPVLPACEGEEISFPWCTIGPSFGTERQV